MEYELSEEKIPIFNSNFEKGNELAEGLIIIKDQSNSKLGFWNKRKAKKAIKHYTECLNLIPNHWQTNWLIAKVYQAMSENKKALEHFKTAVRIEKTNPDLPREASISAMDFGNVKLAVKYSEEAINREPNDAGLYCNHAVNLMVLGNDDEALAYIEKAMEIEPNDEINRNVHSLINDVVSGKRKRPKYNELS
ncbi:tetratricopeptide repeat protein [Aquimarina sp. Aq78]|uniref:tetratricopeptide repeat protein n=1 Tax=Aquimarina sp. Aq78 TaxID=1191889 RepID=UPI000D103261|nr:tetratricopeptide repeat protein [Aquimarina sp. Aq78]